MSVKQTRINIYSMKLKSLSLIFAIALVPQLGMAQQSKSDENVEFQPHFYGQLMGGAAYTVGETTFNNLISPAAALNLGYQFNPVLGLRLGAGGWQGKGATVTPSEAYKFNFLQGNLDLTLNLANLFGYDHARIFNPYLFVGGGAAFGLNNGANDVKAVVPAEYFKLLWADNKLISPVGRAGIGADVRLTDNVALTLEANGNVLSDKFNSKDADNPDFHYNALVGLKITFGKPYRRIEAPVAPVAPVVAQTPKKEDPKKEPVKEVVEEKPVVAADPDVNKYAALNTFFELDSDVIVEEEAAKIADFAAWLNKYGRSVAICGYADVQTGNPKYNMGLSSRRVENVKKALIANGVPASRINTDYKGDTVQPFLQNDMNRVVVSTVL